MLFSGVLLELLGVTTGRQRMTSGSERVTSCWGGTLMVRRPDTRAQAAGPARAVTSFVDTGANGAKCG